MVNEENIAMPTPRPRPMTASQRAQAMPPTARPVQPSQAPAAPRPAPVQPGPEPEEAQEEMPLWEPIEQRAFLGLGNPITKEVVEIPSRDLLPIFQRILTETTELKIGQLEILNSLKATTSAMEKISEAFKA